MFVKSFLALRHNNGRIRSKSLTSRNVRPVFFSPPTPFQDIFRQLDALRFFGAMYEMQFTRTKDRRYVPYKESAFFLIILSESRSPMGLHIFAQPAFSIVIKLLKVWPFVYIQAHSPVFPGIKKDSEWVASFSSVFARHFVCEASQDMCRA